MQALRICLKLLGISTLIFAGSNALAVEQSYPVKCRFFQAGETLRPPLRDGHFLIQTVNNVSSIKLRTSQAEHFISVRSGFEKGQRGSEPTIQALENNFDSVKYILFFRDAAVIQYKDSVGRTTSVMSCQGNDLPKIADSLSGTEVGTVGPMEASSVQAAGGVVSIQPAAGASVPIAPVEAPTLTIPTATGPGTIVIQPTVVPSNGLPPGLLQNLEYLQQQQQQN